MTFIVFLNGKKVKLKYLITTVDNTFTTEHVFSSLTHEEMTNFNDILVEETDAVLAKSTLMLGFLIGSNISTTSEASGEKQQRVGSMAFLKLQPLHQYSFCGSIEIVPVLKSFSVAAAGTSVLETCALAGRVNTILHSFAEGMAFVVATDAAFLRCKEQTPVQKLLEIDVNRSFKIKPLLSIGTCVLNQAGKKIA